MISKRTLGRCGGFTLVEMLVTLVIVGMVVGVLGQALVQLSRIERLLEGGQLDSMAASVRAEWVRSAIESLLPGEAGSADRLRGSEREMKGLSAEVPMLPTPGLAALHLRLVYQPNSATTQLHLLAAPSDTSAAEVAAPVVLLSWPGRAGRFRYLDTAGQWRDDWPGALGAQTTALPLAIALETGLRDMRLLLATPRASDQALPTRRQIEAL